jgi:hypothetical protein
MYWRMGGGRRFVLIAVPGASCIFQLFALILRQEGSCALPFPFLAPNLFPPFVLVGSFSPKNKILFYSILYADLCKIFQYFMAKQQDMMF